MDGNFQVLFVGGASPAPRPWTRIAGVAATLACVGGLMMVHPSRVQLLNTGPAAAPPVLATSPVPARPAATDPSVIDEAALAPVVSVAPRETRPRSTSPPHATTAPPHTAAATAVATGQMPAAAPPAPTDEPPGHLFISSRPWGQLVVDGRVIGNTPTINAVVAAGRHRIQIIHDGFLPFDTQVIVAPGQDFRMIDVTLQERAP